MKDFSKDSYFGLGYFIGILTIMVLGLLYLLRHKIGNFFLGAINFLSHEVSVSVLVVLSVIGIAAIVGWIIALITYKD